MDNYKLGTRLLDFINNSPTAFHAVNTTEDILLKNNFKELKEDEQWNLEKQGKYYVKRNNSAIIAFAMGKESVVENGFKIIGSHTDSPTFRIKPDAEMSVENKYLKLNTEVYGGPILNTWMDRPLSIAGRVILKSNDIMNPVQKFININKPILIIPNLAIHMNRAVNQGFEINPQKHTLPLAKVITENMEKENYLLNLVAKELEVNKEEILDFDLFLYEFEKGCLMGEDNEFISSSRLDDLSMVHASLEAITETEVSKATNVMVAFDNEEVGSATKQGADSMFLDSILERIVEKEDESREAYFRALAKSFIISSDLAHALHPNFTEKNDLTSKPIINKGPVIKVSARQSYTSDSFSSSIYEQICNEARVPVQRFVNRSDERGGSTIGPISSTHISIPSVDIGSPVLAMHSVREFGGVLDHKYIIQSFKKFYSI